MCVLFISDLHLHETRPHITRAFFHFLNTQMQDATALYILGDFFDAWIGDDDDTPLHRDVAQALKTLSDKGTQIFLMHGNRDFLIGEKFSRLAGAQLLAEFSVIDLYGQPTLLLHGDSLCTGDKDYIAFRQQVRSTQWQQHILAQPLATRKMLAAQLREKSQFMNSLKADEIMDVTNDEVIRLLSHHNTTRMIHGHTHRPARHPLTIGDKPCERIVLGDWHHQAWAIKANKNGIDLLSWDI